MHTLLDTLWLVAFIALGVVGVLGIVLADIILRTDYERRRTPQVVFLGFVAPLLMLGAFLLHQFLNR